MEVMEGKYRIVFNGEIYNYKEIRAELEKKNYSFISSSDTEVMLYAFREWGVDAVHRFIGMFAFVLQDTEAGKVYLFRDRPGVKPLYYYWKNNTFLFASELKSFFEHPHFNPEIQPSSVYYFLQYGNVAAPYSIYKDTYKVEPGHYLELDLVKASVKQVKYWSAYDYYNQPVENIDEKEALTELEHRLKKACEYRMVSDVPVGVFLSGGYDSSAVTALLQTGRTQKIKTFTIGFHEQAYNEAGYAKKVAGHLGTDHHEYYCSDAEAKSIIPDLPYYYDEPFGDSSAIPTILVSRFARKQVTVALSADAGDEVFGGYKKYEAALEFSQKISRIPGFLRKPASFFLGQTPHFILRSWLGNKNVSKENISKYRKFIREGSGALDIMQYANRCATPESVAGYLSFTPSPNGRLFHEEELNSGIDEIRQMQAVDWLACLSNDILTKMDRATMSISLEGREPLLDQHIIEWVARIPSKFKIHDGTTKYLLRKIVHKYIPPGIMERPKMGFSIPLVDWFRKDLKELLDHYLSDECLSWHGMFNLSKVKKGLQEYYNGNNSRFVLLWHILMFQLWYEKWMQKKSSSINHAPEVQQAII
jgi:asparagine synthase (glutamine-hydrolysing)